MLKCVTLVQKELKIDKEIKKVSLSINDYGNVVAYLKSKPNELYNLCSQSSVSLSFDQPVEALESITKGTLNILEAIKSIDNEIKFYNAGSSNVW